MRLLTVASALLLVAGALGHAQTSARQSLPVPDLPGYRTLKGDFHLHTVFSDGNPWPTVHVNEVWRDGLDVTRGTGSFARLVPNRREPSTRDSSTAGSP